MTENELFSVLGIPVFPDDLLWLTGILLLMGILYFAFIRYFLPVLRKREDISPEKEQKGKLLVIALSLLIYLEVVIRVLDIRILLFDRLGLSLVVQVLIIIVLVYLVLWLTTNLFIHQYFKKREEVQPTRTLRARDTETSAINALRWLLFAIAVLFLLQYIDWDHTFFEIKSPKGDVPIQIRLSSVLNTLIIYLITRLFLWVLTQIVLHRYYNRQSFDQGIRYSINRLLTYLFYFIATVVALHYLGMNLGLLLGGAAALLVGIGLALQNTFSDFFSGLVLLFERPIAVGDFITYDDKTVQVLHIGLRATKVKDRDSVNFIIPNSKLISQTVVNWSYDEKSARFQVTVGVAYGSDTRLVEELLMQAADEHPEILKRPKPKVLFKDFGNSSLDFVLNYYSKNIYNSEWLKSDLRFRIDELFREHNITIPFPQRDVWMRS
jgi:small-conductance mechanosensitive channel